MVTIPRTHPSVLSHSWLGNRNSIQSVKIPALKISKSLLNFEGPIKCGITLKILAGQTKTASSSNCTSSSSTLQRIYHKLFYLRNIWFLQLVVFDNKCQRHKNDRDQCNTHHEDYHRRTRHCKPLQVLVRRRNET